MPAIPPKKIVGSIIEAVQASGGSAVYLADSYVAHPRKFNIEFCGLRHSLWVYIWTITHGGRPSLPEEFRIQMTSVESPLGLNPSGITLLLGYFLELDIFGGFDLQRHRTFTGGSPSVQIDRSCLRKAQKDGIAFDTKDNDEIAIAFRPEFFLHYAANAESFHKFGASAPNLAILNNVDAEASAVDAESIQATTVEEETSRKLLIRQTRVLARSSKFTRAVISAYEKRCAITGLQLKLLDAAHILPVAAPESKDVVVNGFALQPTFHRAFDNSLIYLTEDYRVKINEEARKRLANEGLLGGISGIEDYDGAQLLLPPDSTQHPDCSLIIKANAYRRIPGY